MPSVKRKKNDASGETFERYERLAFMSHGSNVSKSGLEKLCDHIRKNGLPTATSRAPQYRACKAMCKQLTPYGRLIHEVKAESTKGPPVDLPIQNPFAALHLAASKSGDVARILRDALVRHPCGKDHPWNIVFYQDGVDPSDGLAKHHSRKSNVFYWSFLELGLHALCHEECWFAVTLVRDNTSKSIVGGITQASALALDSFSAPTLMGITLHVTVAL